MQTPPQTTPMAAAPGRRRARFLSSSRLPATLGDLGRAMSMYGGQSLCPRCDRARDERVARRGVAILRRFSLFVTQPPCATLRYHSSYTNLTLPAVALVRLDEDRSSPLRWTSNCSGPDVRENKPSALTTSQPPPSPLPTPDVRIHHELSTMSYRRLVCG